MGKGLPSKVVRSWLAVVFFVFCLFTPSVLHIPTPGGHVVDKLLHFGVYLVAGVVVMRGTCHLPMGQSRLVAACFAFLVAGTIGVVDEVHQLFVPGRQMDRVDLLFDFIGIVVGIFSYLAFQKHKTL